LTKLKHQFLKIPFSVLQVAGFWNKHLQCRELGKTVLYLQVGNQKKLQCEGPVPLYEGLERGGSSVEGGVEQPVVVPSGL
jgi:hypothetical protein